VRFLEDKIKEAILHPDVEIRDRAVSYFAKSFSTDPTIMPLVIQAVEAYGRENDAYRLMGLARDLPQSEDTISWVGFATFSPVDTDSVRLTPNRVAGL
jgi:hypothetical protein